MKCPSDKKCVYDTNGNPMYKLDDVQGQTCKDCECLPQINKDGINTMNYKGADKKVDGAPTNPQPARTDGTLFIEFGPLSNDIDPFTPSEKKAINIFLLIIIITSIIAILFILYNIFKK